MEIRPIAAALVAFVALGACSRDGVGGSASSPDQTTGQMSLKENPVVVFSTSLGDVRVELFPDEAPISVENFLQYVDDGFYDGTVFHRVVPGFVIQGGGFTEDGKQKKTRASIENEARNGLKNERGSLSMARTQAVDSATSQFFVNLVDNAFLDHGTRDYGYAVFARVTDGMDVVDAIAAAGAGSPGDQPREPVVVVSAQRVE